MLPYNPPLVMHLCTVSFEVSSNMNQEYSATAEILFTFIAYTAYQGYDHVCQNQDNNAGNQNFIQPQQRMLHNSFTKIHEI
jgi:hypothetical protein